MTAGTGASPQELRHLDAWWRAANYLSVAQIYLLDNVFLDQPLLDAHIKPRLLGHWGTTPGLNFIYAHLNRLIVRRKAEVLFVAGPGHGGPALCACTWLEGSWSAHYPNVGARCRRRPHAGPPVLVSGRRWQPRHTRGAGVDARGR